MTFIYEMCPHCKGELIERKQPLEDSDSVNFCPKCGKKLVWACCGEQKLDDTMYKIVLNDATASDWRDRKNEFLSTLMKMGNCDMQEALKKYNTKDSIIFEGDVSATYVCIDVLEGFMPSIHYTVIPPFPYERFLDPFVSLCPVCGSDLIWKAEDTDHPNYVKEGLFCEKCNDWYMFNTRSKMVDDEEMLDEQLEHLGQLLKKDQTV